MGSTTGIGPRNHVTANTSDTTTTPATTKSQTTGPVDGRETRTPPATVPGNGGRTGPAAGLAPGAPKAKAEDNSWSWGGAGLGYLGGAALGTGVLIAISVTPPGALVAGLLVGGSAAVGFFAGGEHKRIGNALNHAVGN